MDVIIFNIVLIDMINIYKISLSLIKTFFSKFVVIFLYYPY